MSDVTGVPTPDDRAWHEDELDECPECAGGAEPDTWQSACIDDLCRGGEVPCMHGSYARLPCWLCGK
jgi:hypothetical protein